MKTSVVEIKENRKRLKTNKLEIYYKIKELIRIEDIINKINDNGKIRFYKTIFIKCPCNRSRLVGFEFQCNEKGEINDDVYFRRMCVYRYLQHVQSQIRLYADKQHIDILSQLIGKENIIILLEYWAEMNIFVGNKLIEYITKIKNDSLDKQEKSA